MGFFSIPESCQIGGLDAIYETLFGQRTDGQFVEVGAYDGEQLSNTVGLADLGWRGLYIEPVAEYAARCRRRHERNPAITVEQCAIGDAPGTAQIELAHAFSSFHPDAIAAGKALFEIPGKLNTYGTPIDGIFTGVVETVTVERLEAVLRRHGFEPGFELLVVDVEGHETAVFDGFELAAWRPQALIVELADMLTRDPAVRAKAQAVRSHILAVGYEHVHVDEVNTVFARVS